MNRLISEDLLNKIANYLASQPYIEVAPLIQELAKLPAHVEVNDKINGEEKKPGQTKKN